jgi:dynein heavy chain
MTCVLDDISLPGRNEWGDQVTNELVRQLFELNGFYRLTKPIGEFKIINDVSYVASSKLEAGLSVPNRLLGLMACIYIDQPNEADVAQIIDDMISEFNAAFSTKEEICYLLQRLGKALVKICSTLARSCKVTADRSHYAFGMHQPCTIARCYLSKLQLTNFEQSGAELHIVRLFAHECCRELVDRTVSEDVNPAIAIIESTITEAFPSFAASCSPISARFYSSSLSGPCVESSVGIGDFREIIDLRIAAKSHVEMVMSRQKTGQLVLFDDALHHIFKIARIFESHRKSIILLGVGGSGKQSLARIGSAVAGARFVKPSKRSNQGMTAFMDSLCSSLINSGVKGDSICFLVSEADMCDNVVMDYINQQLICGRITGIFDKDEIDSIVAALGPSHKESNPGSIDSEDDVIDFFWDRVSKHFHFCICISPTGEVFSKLIKQFPGLLSGCTIDWFHPWPMDALKSLAAKFLPDLEERITDSVAQIHALMTKLSCDYYEETGRRTHTTPKSFLSFISSISSLYASKFSELQETRNSLIAGLKKMAATKSQVDQMKIELEDKRVILSQSKEEIASLIGEIDRSTEEAKVERGKVKSIVSRVTKKAREILETKLEAERDLEAAKPALDAALEALNSITAKDITALKSLRKPPDVIKRIMDCVLILSHMPISATSWHEVKGLMVLESSYGEALKMMSDMGFLQKLLSFPKEEINDETVELLQPYFRSDDFNYQSARKASGNVAGLCNWAEAMCKYHMVARDVEPKIVRLKESERELEIAKKEQESAEEDLDKVESSLQTLQERLQRANCDMNQVEQDASTTERKLNNAIILIESLGGEESRWEELNENTQEQANRLLGDCLLASTFTCYLSPVGVTHRVKHMMETQNLCRQFGVETSPEFNPIDFLTDSRQVLKWLDKGLPDDEGSIQNGTLFSSSTRVPYIIDPQGQCVRWIKKMDPNALSIPISSAALLETLELAMIQGVTVIIQNVDSNFGTALDFILQPEDKSCIRMGDKELEVVSGFRTVLTTSLANPVISPETFAKCTVIDFTITCHGLEEQLLGFLISRDEAELHEKRQSLDDDVRRCEAKIKHLENDLLTRLSSHQGDILEDTNLIKVLSETKETTSRVAIQLEQASQTKVTISETCERYRPCAKLASLLYFMLCDFSALNHMYKTSLEQFKGWFDESIKSSITSEKISVSQRVANVMGTLKKTVYIKAQHGIFERDKDPFRLVFATRIHQLHQTDSRCTSDPELLECILSMGNIPVKERSKSREWISNDQWMNLLHLQQQCALLKDLLLDLGSCDAKWKAWMMKERPEEAIHPSLKDPRQLEQLEQLALVRALRPDRIKAAVALFVRSTLGQDFLTSETLSLSHLAAASRANVPIICVISPGADPTAKIHELARKLKTRCLDVSMGQGQEIIARESIAVAMQRGDWVCVQNAHLSVGYLKELEEERQKWGETECNDAFRLWITTEPTNEFPIGLLHGGTRITCEPASGIHDAILPIVNGLDVDLFDEVKMPQWKPMLLSLICMHVLALERKRFGPIGWVVPYEFSSMDLASSICIVSNHLASRRASGVPVDWRALHYLIATIQYGGRIIEQRDQRLMYALVRRFLCEETIESGFISLLNPKKFPKEGPRYSLAVDSSSTKDTILKEIQKLSITEDIPELFGLDAAAEKLALELEGKAMLTRVGTVVAGSVLHTDENSLKIDETDQEGKNRGMFQAELASIPSEPIRAFFKMELSTACFGRTKRYDSLRLAFQHKGRCVWIPSVSNPAALLNALLQDFARRNQPLKVDDLEVEYEVTKHWDGFKIKDPPKEGIYLFGVSLIGAKWNDQRNCVSLKESRKCAEVGWSPFPVLHAKVVEKLAKKRRGRKFECPLYSDPSMKSASLIDFVDLGIDSGLSADELVQCGAALICDRR